MSEKIRVLVVDDSEDDTLLLTDELEHNGYDPTYIRIDTAKAMKTALREQTWDIIIADYTMPQFSGPEALKVLQESGLDIPLILVSGTAEDNVGIDMMRAGAQDFIIKHNLSRLAPAVTRELGEAESRKQRKRAEDSARTSAENYRTMIEYAPVPVVTYNRDAVILQVNPAVEQLFGFSSEEVVGRPIWESFGLPKNAQRTRNIVERVFSGEIVKNLDYEDVRKDGTPVYVLVNITPISNELGEVTMALAMITDITERKLAEERERERDAHKQEFYRRTILAATDGKLLISEKEEIESIGGLQLGCWTISNRQELSAMRDDISRISREEGMAEHRLPYLLSCVVEASANALKHAGSGHASLFRKGDSLVFMISDSGPGIGALALPDVALIKGYSTAGTLGMGYKLMIQSADRIYLATGPGGTTVAAEVSINPRPSEQDTQSQ